MIDLVRATPYVAMHRDATFVIKVGGGSLARPAARRALAKQVATVAALGSRVVLVHGGGPQTDDLQRLLGEEPRMIGGRRVTSETALRALRLATRGELNGDLSAAITATGASAVGLAAACAGTLVARRRPPVETESGVVDFGCVGDVVSCDPRAVQTLLDAGLIPVISPPASDGEGGFLNVNADVAAAAIAVALGAVKLILATGAPGILRVADDPESIVSALSLAELDALAARGALRDGMAVKATAIGTALRGGVGRVHVISGSDEDALLRELYTTHGAGTLVTAEPERAPEAELAQRPPTARSADAVVGNRGLQPSSR